MNRRYTKRRLSTLVNLATVGLLLPVLGWQALKIRRDTPRLPEAAGTTGVACGSGPTRTNLVVLGESTAAGVGATSNDEALAGHLADVLSKYSAATIDWRVFARYGATARYTSHKLLPTLANDIQYSPCDAVVVAVGVNDLLRLRWLTSWQDDVDELLEVLRSQLGKVVPIVVAGLPPIAQFHALPQPLRFILARRARSMDQILAKSASGYGASFINLEARLDEGFFAADHFHPSSYGYRLWAKVLAMPLMAHFDGTDIPTGNRAGQAHNYLG